MTLKTQVQRRRVLHGWLYRRDPVSLEQTELASQNGLAQHVRALQIRVDLRLDLTNDRAAAIDFGDDTVLLIQGRKR